MTSLFPFMAQYFRLKVTPEQGNMGLLWGASDRAADTFSDTFRCSCVCSMFPQSLAATEIAIKLLAIYNESLELYHTEHGTRL